MIRTYCDNCGRHIAQSRAEMDVTVTLEGSRSVDPINVSITAGVAGRQSRDLCRDCVTLALLQVVADARPDLLIHYQPVAEAARAQAVREIGAETARLRGGVEAALSWLDLIAGQGAPVSEGVAHEAAQTAAKVRAAVYFAQGSAQQSEAA